MRWAAAILAALVGFAQLVLFVLAQRQVEGALEALEPSLEATWIRWVWAVAWALPWLVGTAMFVAGATRRAVAVVLTAAVLVASAGLGSLQGLATRPPVAATSPWIDWVAHLGGAAVWFLAVAAGLLAWLARPRGGWRIEAPGPVGWYVTVAVLAWLPAAFRTSQFAPPGAPRAFVETVASQSTGLDLIASVASAGVVGLLLLVAPRLRPDMAGTVLLTYALPALLASLGSALRVVVEDDMILTPSGVLGLIGVVGLVVAGAIWAPRRIRHTSIDADS